MEVLWNKCLNLIEKEILPESFNTWFTSTQPYNLDEKSLTISVPNEFSKNYLTENYEELIKNSLKTITRFPLEINFLVQESSTSAEGNKEKPLVTSIDSPSIEGDGQSLNKKYQFSNFVVGSCNQFAHAASHAISSNQALSYNPLFIYGSAGLGKTHLLHAIGNQILEDYPDSRVRYVSSEGFTIDLIQSIKKDDMNAFRKRYRPLDVLLVDDIQFLAGKDRTQEEFFYTFNTLYESHKQIVLTSDTFPKDMNKIEERLRSRFECGLIADMKPPDLETKVAILYKKCEQHQIDIPQDVAIFVAGNIRSNIRELEGLLLRLIAYSSFMKKKIDMELTKEVLKEFILDQTKNFNVPNILKQVASHFNIKVSEIKSKKRSRNISVPRQIAMYICRENTKTSLPEIGKEFGGKDHTTVIYSHNKISKLIKQNNDLENTVRNIIERIETA